MKYLLDTHVVLWFLSGSDKLSNAALKIILEPVNYKYISVVSVWELAIKLSLGKIKYDGGVSNFVETVDENGFSLLSLDEKHVCQLESLPFHHKDPFDRMLIAVATYENMNFITSDDNIHLYKNVYCVW